MIRNEPTITLLSGSSSTSSLFSFRSGETVKAHVIGSDSSGKLLLNIAGKTIAATGMKHFQSGDVFQAKVVITGSTVFLQPVSEFSNSSPSLLIQLGLPNTPLHQYVLSFLQGLQVRLIPEKIQNFVRIAAKFPGKEKEAVKAAAILDERDIELSEKNILVFISAIEGRLLEDDRDFIAYVNKKAGASRHWIVLPFQKRIVNTDYRGSVRFLLDLVSSKTIETGITFINEDLRWEFSLTAEQCICSTDPLFNTNLADTIIVYLKELLAEFNIFDISFRSLDGEYKTEGVDVQV